MAGEQLAIHIGGGGKALDSVLVGITSKKLNGKLAGMDIKRKIDLLETALEHTSDTEAKRTINISLGDFCLSVSSSLGYGPEFERCRADYLVKTIRAYERAGFDIGNIAERKKLYGLYRYASNICTNAIMQKEAAEFFEKMHTLGRSCSAINIKPAIKQITEDEKNRERFRLRCGDKLYVEEHQP